MSSFRFNGKLVLGRTLSQALKGLRDTLITSNPFCADCRLHNSCEAEKMQLLQGYKLLCAAQDLPAKQARFQFVRQPTNGPDTRTMWKQRVEMPLFLKAGETGVSTRNSLLPELRACFPQSRGIFSVPKL